jgi:endonuclease G, mitochondrial
MALSQPVCPAAGAAATGAQLTPHLPADRVVELTKAAVSAGVIAGSRAVWLAGIDQGFVGFLDLNPSPIIQFQLDLNTMNRVERLADGSVPLSLYLHNIAESLKVTARPEASIFDRAANDVDLKTQGGVALPSLATVPEVIQKQAIVHFDDMVSISFLSAALTVSRSVGRISTPRFDNGTPRMLANGNPWVMNGSAWLIAPDLIVTNHHVVNAREQNEPPASAADFTRQGQGATLTFDFDGAGGGTAPVAIAQVVIADEPLDYAVLRLAASSNRAPLRLRRTPFTLAQGDRVPVNIIQHPRGEAKKIAFRNNLVSGTDADTIRYFTDTDYGSSGAPVCDDAWQVVALHRGAVYADNVSFQGKTTAYVNFGTRTDVFLEDIEQRAPGAHGEIVAAN